MRECLLPHLGKAALTFLLGGLFNCPALAQNEVCSAVRFKATGMEVRMEHQIGIWEDPGFVFTKLKNFSSKHITIKVSTVDGNYEGPGITLQFPDGHRQSHGSDYLDLKKRPAEFPDYLSLTKVLAPKQSFSSDRISLRHCFGTLAAGLYKLRVEIPGERYHLDGEAGGKLDSGWLEFEIVPMSQRVQEVLQQAQLKGVETKLVPEKTSATAKAWIVEIQCALKNNFPKPVEIFGEKNSVHNGVERLDGSLEWRPHNSWCSYCGDGAGFHQVDPGASFSPVVHIPGDSGIYRAVLTTAPDGLKIYSPPIQIVSEREP